MKFHAGRKNGDYMKTLILTLAALTLIGCAQTVVTETSSDQHGIGTYSQGAGTAHGDKYGNTEGSGGQL